MFVAECGSRGSELHDLLTCGDCLEEFPLSDIVRFIRHKVSHGAGRCSTSSPPADDDDDGEMDMATPRPGEDAAAATADGQGSTAAVHVEDRRRHLSPSRHLDCDSSQPGEDGPAADNRLNGDADDCFTHQSTCTGQ